MASRTKSERGRASEGAEAARQRLAAQQRRQRLVRVFAAVGAVVLVIAVLVIVKAVSGSGGASSGPRASSASASVTGKVASVPARVLDQVGVGSAQVAPKYVASAPALTSGGKPRVLYAGAEYCPFCATERWPLVVALSRFGTFAHLSETRSSASDVYPSTATLSFHGATYRSPYLTLTAKELESNKVVGGQYAPLDHLSNADAAIVNKYDAPPYFPQHGSIPFVDIGGKYLLSGASYSPTVLQGLNQKRIAAALSDPSSPIAKGVDGTANLITAAVCRVTDNKPGAVCNSAGVRTGAAKLGNAG
jgi:hypothetical protein